ncbi:LRR receptor-like serine/threonine-protein kinase EFR [Prunus yedoensis var. nudiflora]|uniref:LRR receptor-like serine/threonine-protein kinase EFR n=1 Tax=Prunus yedoensis var. nudiflora TaxID=2094558 RepID=A0A314ZYP2_PRUYE|nr:LRR receptor-like serine/threonine-protein kinase EFR [Prunus yedoensis var. nudiflora]
MRLNLGARVYCMRQLSGSLPADLQQLLVGDNKLSGTIPGFITNGSNKLTRLDITANSFFGFIPTTLRAFTNLQWLNLQWNNLTVNASIPVKNFLPCLASLRNLSMISLEGNPLNATLPVFFGNLSTKLEIVDLGNCNMRECFQQVGMCTVLKLQPQHTVHN